MRSIANGSNASGEPAKASLSSLEDALGLSSMEAVSGSQKDDMAVSFILTYADMEINGTVDGFLMRLRRIGRAIADVTAAKLRALDPLLVNPDYAPAVSSQSHASTSGNADTDAVDSNTETGAYPYDAGQTDGTGANSQQYVGDWRTAYGKSTAGPTHSETAGTSDSTVTTITKTLSPIEQGANQTALLQFVVSDWVAAFDSCFIVIQ